MHSSSLFRNSHTGIAYKKQFLIIIGGEDANQDAFNDIWKFDIHTKEWTEIKPSKSHLFEGRCCHSSSLNNEKIYIYGGLKNVDVTLDNLAILCLDGKVSEIEEKVKINEPTTSISYSFDSKFNI